MKKTRTAVLSAALVIGIILILFLFRIVANGSCGDNVTWKLMFGTLTISGEGGTDYMPGSPFAENRTVRRVIISDGVTGIGDSLFEDCRSIRSVDVPGSVTEIGSFAFCGCEELTDITLSEGLTSIRSNAFRECSSLKVITVPDSVEFIGIGVFYKCSDELVIKGSENSAAQKYAEENGIRFETEG